MVNGLIFNNQITAKTFALINRLIFLFAALFFIGKSQAQQIPDTLFRQNSINALLHFYQQSIGVQTHLNNAPEYEPYYFSFSDGHPYFLFDAFTPGSVEYDGMVYSNLPLKYDLIRDELVMLYADVFKLNLIKEKINSFSLLGHSFIKIAKDSAGTLHPGFYDQLYSGTVVFLCRHVKNIEEQTNLVLTIETKIHSENHYYVLKNGVYHFIKNKNSLLDVLKDKRNQLQVYIRKNDLKFKGSLEEDMVNLVAYYDQLSK